MKTADAVSASPTSMPEVQWLRHEGRMEAFTLTAQGRLSAYNIGKAIDLMPGSIFLNNVAYPTDSATRACYYSLPGGRVPDDPIHVRGRKCPQAKPGDATLQSI